MFEAGATDGCAALSDGGCVFVTGGCAVAACGTLLDIIAPADIGSNISPMTSAVDFDVISVEITVDVIGVITGHGRYWFCVTSSIIRKRRYSYSQLLSRKKTSLISFSIIKLSSSI